MVSYGLRVGETHEELELARISFAVDSLGCGVLFGVTLLALVGAVIAMAAGLGLLAFGLGCATMVLGACTGDLLEKAMVSRLRVRDLGVRLDGLVRD